MKQRQPIVVRRSLWMRGVAFCWAKAVILAVSVELALTHNLIPFVPRSCVHQD